MPAKSKSQFRLMAMLANDPEMAKKKGMKPGVAAEFISHNTGKSKYAKLPEKMAMGGKPSISENPPPAYAKGGHVSDSEQWGDYNKGGMAHYDEGGFIDMVKKSFEDPPAAANPNNRAPDKAKAAAFAKGMGDEGWAKGGMIPTEDESEQERMYRNPSEDDIKQHNADMLPQDEEEQEKEPMDEIADMPKPHKNLEVLHSHLKHLARRILGIK